MLYEVITIHVSQLTLDLLRQFLSLLRHRNFIPFAGAGWIVRERPQLLLGAEYLLTEGGGINVDPRITSYNVCYTKLLRIPSRSRASSTSVSRRRAWGESSRGSRPSSEAINPPLSGFVITSYSIHYTKLYELT